MKSRDVKKFLKPKSIAVIGASETPGKIGYILMKKLSYFKGSVIPINLHKKTILGKIAYDSVKRVSGKIDLAIIATPAETVNMILRQCGIKKIKNVIIISAGFSETGNKDLQTKIKSIAKAYKINVLGPNCFGVANPYKRLDTTFAKSPPNSGKIAFISQSGALWSYIADLENNSFSGFVSLGNMADLSFTQFIRYFNKDKKTKKIILYIEKLKLGKEFIRICKNSKKEIVAVKAGKSEEGSKATMSHTASLATDYEIYKGAFKQANVKLIKSLSEALNKNSKITFPKPQKIKSRNKTAIITNAGGAGAIIADQCEENGFDLTQKPLDILGTATPDDYKIALNEISKQKNVDTIMVVLTPQSMSNPESVAGKIIEFSRERLGKNKRIIAFFLGEKSMKNSWDILEKEGIEVVKGI